MDDLLREFLTETFENIDIVDREIVRFEKNPRDKEALDKIFRLVHTIKGTCGFLGLSRLEALAHAGETVLGHFREGGLEVTPAAVSLILRTIDRIKEILLGLEAQHSEPSGGDQDLVDALERLTPNAEAGDATIGAMLETSPDSDSDNEFVDEKRRGESNIAGQSIRVGVSLLERMMTLVGELVLTRNQLLQMVRTQESSDFNVPLQRLSNVTSDLQDSVMKTRMQPIGSAWAKLPRLVRDLAEELGKKISLELEGAETELDRQVMELVKDPLVHMVRNSADHGLETPAERKAAGKPETGHIKLRAHHEGGHIVIEVTDDGHGLSTPKICEKAVRLGLVTEAELERMSEQQIHKFIFDAGFSTADKVTSVSGRGVGLDVVRTNIEQIGGAIDLRSIAKQGTTFTIKIPLTLAIVPALIVSAAGQRYAIPQIAVVELVRTKAGAEHRVELIHETPVLRLRERLLPLVDLASTLGADAGLGSRQESFVIVMQVGSQRFGVIVDKIHDTEEIVVKPVARMLRDISIFSGNTILGDGSVILIIDPNGIASMVTQGATEGRHEQGVASVGSAREEDRTPLLVFRAGSGDQKAVPLSLVTRLEETDARNIERCDGRRLLQYRGRLVPVLHVESEDLIRSEGRQALLVFTQDNRSVALAVDEIVDITNEKLDIEIASTRPGRVGSATVNGHATEIVDVAHFLVQVYPDWLESGARMETSKSKSLFDDYVAKFERDELLAAQRPGKSSKGAAA